MIRKYGVILGVFVLGLVAWRMSAQGAVSPVDLDLYLLRVGQQSIFRVTPLNRTDTGCTAWTALGARGEPVTVTNSHCAALADKDGLLAAHLSNGKRHVIRLMYDSQTTDLSIFTAVPNTVPLRLASSINETERVHVVGHPFLYKIVYARGHVVQEMETKFIDSHRTEENCFGNKYSYEEITIWGLFKTKACIVTVQAIQTTAQIYGGNSGSPVFNDSAEVVGVAFASDNESHWGAIVRLDDLQAILKLF